MSAPVYSCSKSANEGAKQLRKCFGMLLCHWANTFRTSFHSSMCDVVGRCWCRSIIQRVPLIHAHGFTLVYPVWVCATMATGNTHAHAQEIPLYLINNAISRNMIIFIIIRLSFQAPGYDFCTFPVSSSSHCTSPARNLPIPARSLGVRFSYYVLLLFSLLVRHICLIYGAWYMGTISVWKIWNGKPRDMAANEKWKDSQLRSVGENNLFAVERRATSVAWTRE